MASDATRRSRKGRHRGREEQLICFALVRALKMIMLNKLSYCAAQGWFTKEDELG